LDASIVQGASGKCLPKTAPSRWEMRTPINVRVLTQVCPKKHIQRLAVFEQPYGRDQHTNHTTPSVATARIYARPLYMRCELIINCFFRSLERRKINRKSCILLQITSKIETLCFSSNGIFWLWQKNFTKKLHSGQKCPKLLNFPTVF